jgi:hypothetical protein
MDIVCPDGGIAQVAETRLRGDWLIVRRTRLVGEQAKVFPTWRYHALSPTGSARRWSWTPTTVATPRSSCASVISKGGVRLRYCPSGKFSANATWLLAATLAHNLLRCVAAIGLGAPQELVVAKTLRHILLALPSRLTRSARHLVLHLRVQAAVVGRYRSAPLAVTPR